MYDIQHYVDSGSFFIVVFKNAEIGKVNNVLETTSFQGVKFTLFYFSIFGTLDGKQYHKAK